VGDIHRFVVIIRRLSELALIGCFLFALLFDVIVLLNLQAVVAEVPVTVSSVLGFVAVLLRRRWLRVAMPVFLVVSFLTSAFHVTLSELSNFYGHPGATEVGALLLLPITALRTVKPFLLAAGLAIADMVVLELTAARYSSPGEITIGFMFFVLWSTAAAIGGYLRYQQERREEAVKAVRRAERLDIARELHDLVAHHITGIVVQAQAARTIAEQKPEAVPPALDAIAAAGTEALTSMRRLVSVLRADDDAARTPGAALSDLRALVDNFTANGGPQVAFEIGQGVSSANLPPEVLTTLHRVLQESLTNIRKHAPGSAWVEVDLSLVPEGVRLRVRNYGGGSFGGGGDSRLRRLGGGFGLVGMAERVEALGGTLTYGQTVDGAWEVCAVLKCDT
jgi:signal transduction histidine kinase